MAPVLKAFARFGVVVECHLQNTLIAVDAHGTPSSPSSATRRPPSRFPRRSVRRHDQSALPPAPRGRHRAALPFPVPNPLMTA
ncbi:hypothetical protein [Streptomyces sp. NPDC088707]|uniref:hypothetical protein n=1 Tax=Streptomyces sp. NPDC088707 TaxID=3365871 RepID=UPI00381568E8